jgi:hypothetical protein
MMVERRRLMMSEKNGSIKKFKSFIREHDCKHFDNGTEHRYGPSYFVLRASLSVACILNSFSEGT